MTDQSAPVMIDLRLLPAAAATWAATWWATTHPAPWTLVGACVLAACACAASYARSRHFARPPRHALTPPRSVRMAITLLCTCLACALAVASAAGRQYDADPARRDSGPIRVRVALAGDPVPSSGYLARRRARVRIVAVAHGQHGCPPRPAPWSARPAGRKPRAGMFSR